jgi:hypothetical protein
MSKKTNTNTRNFLEEINLIVIPSTKGGDGKSTLSTLAPLIFKSHNFNILEFDNNNNSLLSYSQSESLKGRVNNLKVVKADDTLDDVISEIAMQDDNKYIIDCGGGDDSVSLLKLLSIQPFQHKILYLVPITRGTDLKNLKDTYDLIDNKNNVVFVLNGYSSIEEIKNEFFFYFGDIKYDIRGFIDSVVNKTPILIPFSRFFSITKTFQMSLFDLSQLSKVYNSQQAAADDFMKKSGGDLRSERYRTLWKKYKISLRASEVIDEIKDNFKILEAYPFPDTK